MDVNRLKVSQELEKSDGSKALEKILTRNTIETKKRKEREKKKKEKAPAKKEENWVEKLGRKVKEVIHGEKTYISKERAAEMKAQRKTKKAKPTKTKRTKRVEGGLKKAGLTDKELMRLR